MTASQENIMRIFFEPWNFRKSFLQTPDFISGIESITLKTLTVHSLWKTHLGASISYPLFSYFTYSQMTKHSSVRPLEIRTLLDFEFQYLSIFMAEISKISKFSPFLCCKVYKISRVYLRSFRLDVNFSSIFKYFWW